MIQFATLLLLLALPFLLWPLVRPPELTIPTENPATGRDDLAHQVEEVELDLASGRLDRPEAERRLAELRKEAG
ncbi:MAG: c-type cytochrome biogenesis protein CcmI [Candidatus Dormibacteraeota bacterium]|nr:c-type cytochrome biogenesis protein CcmI [Candidatus Dormibacteraeota bacterium]